MSRTYFLTGITGFVGAEVASLLRADPTHRVFCLIRSGEDPAEKRLRAILEQFGEVNEGQFIPVEGDLRRPRLGLDDRLYDQLTSEITHVVHSAADVRFTLPLEKIRCINVDGTREMLQLALDSQRRNPQFSHLDYVSTAYVAGRRQGSVRSEQLTDRYGFKNAYEQSKFEAEKLVREHREQLGIVIYRPSIILGAAATGRARQLNAIYPMLRLLRDWPFSFVSARWNARLDLVPVDFAASALLWLSDQPESRGHCFYLASGEEGDLTIARFCRVVGREFGRYYINVPHFIYYRTFWQLIRRRHPDIASQNSVMDAFDPYIHEAGPRFDASATREALQSSGLRLPDTEEHIQACCRYALRTDFGLRPDDGAAASE